MEFRSEIKTTVGGCEKELLRVYSESGGLLVPSMIYLSIIRPLVSLGNETSLVHTIDRLVNRHL